MTTEEKAKAYDEMVQRIKELHEAGNALTKKQMEILIPELAESEDERIRKELIEQVEYLLPDNEELDDEGRVLPTYHKRIGRYRAYLEKQKDANKEYWRGYREGKQEILDKYAEIEKQKEPHYTKRNALFDKCVENCNPEVMKKVSDEIDVQLEKEQKSAEWSEEDENYYNEVCKCIEKATQDSAAEHELLFWLKSRRPSWKPSEEQIRVFLKATPVNLMPEELSIYKSLCNDIQKLM